MTNKTDEMPQEIWVQKYRLGRYDATTEPVVNMPNVKYTRSIDISDERVKEAENEFLEAHLDADLSIETQDTIKRVLSDYGQMVECIRDMSIACSSSHSVSTTIRRSVLVKHADIIKKCRGKDNG